MTNEVITKAILLSIITLLYFGLDKYAYRFWAKNTILDYPPKLRRFMWRSSFWIVLIGFWIVVLKYVHLT